MGWEWGRAKASQRHTAFPSQPHKQGAQWPLKTIKNIGWMAIKQLCIWVTVSTFLGWVSGLNFKHFPSISKSNHHLPPAAHSSFCVRSKTLRKPQQSLLILQRRTGQRTGVGLHSFDFSTWRTEPPEQKSQFFLKAIRYKLTAAKSPKIQAQSLGILLSFTPSLLVWWLKSVSSCPCR